VTGPEHYAEAERLLPIATQLMDSQQDALAMPVLAKAQVHVMLAGVWAHNRALTELTGLLRLMLDQASEAREQAAQ
jgi:hypothetical protein